MRYVDLMIEHGYLITVDAQRRLIEDGTVVIAADRIVDVGPASLMAERYQAATHLDATHKIVLPGLIDTHSHAGCSLTKTLGMHLGNPRWFVMLDHVQFRGTGAEYWYADGLLMALERLKFGVTTRSRHAGGHAAGGPPGAVRAVRRRHGGGRHPRRHRGGPRAPAVAEEVLLVGGWTQDRLARDDGRHLSRRRRPGHPAARRRGGPDQHLGQRIALPGAIAV